MHTMKHNQYDGVHAGARSRGRSKNGARDNKHNNNNNKIQHMRTFWHVVHTEGKEAHTQQNEGPDQSGTRHLDVFVFFGKENRWRIGTQLNKICCVFWLFFGGPVWAFGHAALPLLSSAVHFCVRSLALFGSRLAAATASFLDAT